MVSWSNFPPRFQAPRLTPSHTPMTVARIVEDPTSRIVGHIRSRIRSETPARYNFTETPEIPGQGVLEEGDELLEQRLVETVCSG